LHRNPDVQYNLKSNTLDGYATLRPTEWRVSPKFDALTEWKTALASQAEPKPNKWHGMRLYSIIENPRECLLDVERSGAAGLKY